MLDFLKNLRDLTYTNPESRREELLKSPHADLTRLVVLGHLVILQPPFITYILPGLHEDSGVQNLCLIIIPRATILPPIPH